MHDMPLAQCRLFLFCIWTNRGPSAGVFRRERVLPKQKNAGLQGTLHKNTAGAVTPFCADRGVGFAGLVDESTLSDRPDVGRQPTSDGNHPDRRPDQCSDQRLS